MANPSPNVEPAEGPNNTSPASVAKFAGIMTGAIALSRLLGMLRDTAMAYKFGLGLDTDSFSIAAQLPDLIFMLIAGGGLSSAFIPVFSDLIHKGKQKEAWRVFSVVVTTCSIIAIALVAVVWALAPQIVAYLAHDKNPVIVPSAIAMSRIMLPAQFAFLIGSILMATLYAREFFIAPALAPNIYNICIILGALVLPGLVPGIGIQSMAWGALVGAFIGNLVLPILAMGRVGSRFTPSLQLSAPGVDKFFKLLLPVIVGFSLPSMVNLITQNFASVYNVDGLNTVMRYSNNLMQAPLGIFGQGLALGVFPVLAKYVATDRMDLYRDQVSRTLSTVLYLGVASGALMFGLAPLIVDVLYGYGAAAANPHNLHAIAHCVQIYSFAVFAWCAQPVLMRGFFSLHKTFKPIAIGTAMTVVFFALCAFATRASGNFLFLPLATNVAAILLAILLFFALEADVGKLDRPRIFTTLLLSSLAAVAAGLVCFGLVQLFHPHHRWLEFIALLLFSLIGWWVYYFVTRWMKMPETEYLDRAMARISRRNRPQR